jgi:hypothetical protein
MSLRKKWREEALFCRWFKKKLAEESGFTREDWAEN